MERLTRLANKYKTDKGTEFEDAHGYTEFYQQFFEKYENPKIIEVGVWHGGSIRMLNDFFDGECEIWALDYDTSLKQYVEDIPNVHFVCVDASDKNSIKEFKDKWDFDSLWGWDFAFLAMTLAKLGRNEDVSMDVLKRICDYFKCDVGDIMEMIPDKEGK